MTSSTIDQAAKNRETTTHTTVSREDHPPELAPYWPSRIKEDRIWYGDYAKLDERFYDPGNSHIYRITGLEHGQDVFKLEPCAIATDFGGDGFVQPSNPSNHQIDNICALAGAIELGELIHLEKGALREIGNATFLSVGQLTVEIDNTSADANALLKELKTPNAPDVTDLAKIAPTLSGTSTEATLYAPQSVGGKQKKTPQPDSHRSPNSAQNVETHFIPVSPFSRWTFEDDSIRDWVESNFDKGDTILNACAGKTELTPPQNGQIFRNDSNSSREADFHVDVAELAGLDFFEAKCIDKIIFDPPWSLYQANLRYQSEHVHQVSKDGAPNIDLSELPFETPNNNEKTQIGHAAIAKRGFDHLLKPGGEVIELTFHGTSMPSSMGYERQERVIFDPVGEARAVIGSVDKKTRQELTDFF
jgi:hypothetical protein